MERVNASMAVVSSFSSEVSGIHTSMAQLDSRMDGLVNKVGVVIRAPLLLTIRCRIGNVY